MVFSANIIFDEWIADHFQWFSVVTMYGQKSLGVYLCIFASMSSLFTGYERARCSTLSRTCRRNCYCHYKVRQGKSDSRKIKTPDEVYVNSLAQHCRPLFSETIGYHVVCVLMARMELPLNCRSSQNIILSYDARTWLVPVSYRQLINLLTD